MLDHTAALPRLSRAPIAHIETIPLWRIRDHAGSRNIKRQKLTLWDYFPQCKALEIALRSTATLQWNRGIAPCYPVKSWLQPFIELALIPYEDSQSRNSIGYLFRKVLDIGVRIDSLEQACDRYHSPLSLCDSWWQDPDIDPCGPVPDSACSGTQEQWVVENVGPFSTGVARLLCSTCENFETSKIIV